MSATTSLVKKFVILLLVLVSSSFCKIYAAGEVKVNTGKNSTSIQVTNFPKNTTILIVDEDFNLLSVGSTNETGRATIEINKIVLKPVIVRTVHGDVQASDKVEPTETTDTTSVTVA